MLLGEVTAVAVAVNRDSWVNSKRFFSKTSLESFSSSLDAHFIIGYTFWSHHRCLCFLNSALATFTVYLLPIFPLYLVCAWLIKFYTHTHCPNGCFSFSFSCSQRLLMLLTRLANHPHTTMNLSAFCIEHRQSEREQNWVHLLHSCFSVYRNFSVYSSFESTLNHNLPWALIYVDHYSSFCLTSFVITILMMMTAWMMKNLPL